MARTGNLHTAAAPAPAPTPTTSSSSSVAAAWVTSGIQIFNNQPSLKNKYALDFQLELNFCIALYTGFGTRHVIGLPECVKRARKVSNRFPTSLLPYSYGRGHLKCACNAAWQLKHLKLDLNLAYPILLYCFLFALLLSYLVEKIELYLKHDNSRS